MVSTTQTFSQVLGLIGQPKRDQEPIHQLFAYPAKFQAAVPRLIIEKFTSPGDWVLDPFGGGGTTSAAARVLQRNSIHFDLNPVACLVARAKLSRPHHEEVGELLEKLSAVRGHSKLLTSEERLLFGGSVTEVCEKVWHVLRISSDNLASPVLACLLIKFLKLVGRRDAQARREKPAAEHLRWLRNELNSYSQELFEIPLSRHKIFCKSNHQMHLEEGSIPLIITSPPYPGVDIEYDEIQIQRRDLNRCFRSGVATRIANLYYEGDPGKKTLCRGGDESQDYFANARFSLQAMRRVLHRKGLCFIYCGFKTVKQAAQYEELIIQSGFRLLEKGVVQLSKDRVASGRSLHHGKDTHLMKCDYLYILG